MSAPSKLNFKIYQGGTFKETLRWESPNIVYKNITNISKNAPAVVTSAAHGLVLGWRAWVNSVLGMREINSDEPYTITNLTTDSVELGEVNSLGYTAYASSGVLQYYAPVDLSGYTARMQLRSKLDSPDVILSLTTENGRIAIDNVLKTITLNITAADTAALNFSSAIYSLEMVSGTSVVTPLLTGTVSLVKEITR